MSAANASCRPWRRPGSGVIVTAALLTVFAPSGQAQPMSASPSTASALKMWDGESDVTLEELKRQAGKVGELLDDASARVERLADDEADPLAGRALVGALRQELDLSRQWNSHLTRILLDVAKARQDLAAREQQAAAKILELTSIAEQARLDLIALKESLTLEQDAPEHQPDRLPIQRPAPDQNSAIETERGRTMALTVVAGPDPIIKEARQALEDMNAAQMTAVADIEAVRAKIIDALHTLAPHRKGSFRFEGDDGRQIGGRLASKDITAWAASIASKLHHEGFEGIEEAKDEAGSRGLSVPDVEVMVMTGEALSTATVRIAPDRRATSIATVEAGSSVLVTGKVIDLDWYRVEIEGGRHGFVAGDLIKPGKAKDGWRRPVKAS